MAAEQHCQLVVYIVPGMEELKVHKTVTKIAFLFSFYVVCVPNAEEHTGQLC